MKSVMSTRGKFFAGFFAMVFSTALMADVLQGAVRLGEESGRR